MSNNHAIETLKGAKQRIARDREMFMRHLEEAKQRMQQADSDLAQCNADENDIDAAIKDLGGG